MELMKGKEKIGAVMVIGGGVGGVQAALDLAESGYKVYLVEDSPAIGGVMAQLDKTFPTNDCSMCILSPKLVECGRHKNIEILTNTSVTGIKGDAGNFTVTLLKKPRYVDIEKCVACGACTEKCPIKVKDEYNEGLMERKAIYIPYPQAVPLSYLIDPEHCRYLTKGKCKLCEKFCQSKAINFDEKEETIEVPNVGGRRARALSRQILAEIIEPRVEEIFTLIHQEIVKAGYEDLIPSGVVLTGGTASLEGLPEFVEGIFDLPVRRGYPTGVGGLLDVVNHPMYATGVGLVLYGKRHASEMQYRTGEERGALSKALQRMKGWFREFA